MNLALVLIVGLLAALNPESRLREGFERRSAPPIQQQAPSSQAQQAFDRVIQSLQAVDTAYASGNTAEAQAKFDQAMSDWNVVAPAISAREAREAQLLFTALGDQLKSSAPASKVSATIQGMLGELRSDIQRELGK